MTELPLMRVELAVVMGAEHVVQIFVMNHRLDDERWDVRRVQQRMNANLRGVMVVRAEADGAAAFARDLLAPSNDERRHFQKVRPMDAAGQRIEVMKRLFRDGE